MEIHNETTKHLKKKQNTLNKGTMKQTETNLGQKISNNYSCDICHYTTCRKSQYDRHINTSKHIIVTNNVTSETTKVPKELFCVCGELFNNRTTLWRHKNKCELLYCNNDEHAVENYATHENTNSDNDIIMMVIKQNKELKDFLVEQNKQNVELQNKVIELCKYNTNITNNTNSINTANTNITTNANNITTANTNITNNTNSIDTINTKLTGVSYMAGSNVLASITNITNDTEDLVVGRIEFQSGTIADFTLNYLSEEYQRYFDILENEIDK
jgi:hypothetical protein